MKIRKIMLMAAVVTVALVYGGMAQANTVSGGLWHVPEAVVNSASGATPGNVPGTTADVTFQVNSPFTFNNTAQDTVTNWLTSGGAFNINENTVGTLGSLMDNGTQGTLVRFTGQVTVTQNQFFTVTHDDGLTLDIGGLLVVNLPGPHSPVTDTVQYTGPSGTFAFDLVYSECCGGPAELQISLPLETVPEPATGFLLVTGIIGLLGYGRRKR